MTVAVKRHLRSVGVDDGPAAGEVTVESGESEREGEGDGVRDPDEPAACVRRPRDEEAGVGVVDMVLG